MPDDTKLPAIPAERSQAIAERKERRALAIRDAGKETHDVLGAAIHQWATYTGPDNVGPTQSEDKYHMTFKRLIYPRLKTDQRVSRDDMTRVELMAIIAMEESIAAALTDGMARRETRDDIKTRYREAADNTAAAMLPAIMSDRGRQ